MSLKKGCTYENVKEFCEKYGCELKSNKYEIDRSIDLTILSKCGHEKCDNDYYWFHINDKKNFMLYQKIF
jgi:hypothetical protein